MGLIQKPINGNYSDFPWMGFENGLIKHHFPPSKPLMGFDIFFLCISH